MDIIRSDIIRPDFEIFRAAIRARVNERYHNYNSYVYNKFSVLQGVSARN